MLYSTYIILLSYDQIIGNLIQVSGLQIDFLDFEKKNALMKKIFLKNCYLLHINNRSLLYYIKLFNEYLVQGYVERRRALTMRYLE